MEGAAAVDPLRAARLAGGRRRQAALVSRRQPAVQVRRCRCPAAPLFPHLTPRSPFLVQAIVANATQFMHQFVDDDLERKVMLGLRSATTRTSCLSTTTARRSTRAPDGFSAARRCAVQNVNQK